VANDAPSVDVRVALEAERDQLRSQLDELGFGEEGGLTYDTNFADTSQVTAERGEAEVVATTLRETLSEIEAALTKLEAGTYGACATCGSVIDPLRLEAMPAATQCIACASKR